MASAYADLAARQRSLVAALVMRATPPAGVDPRRVEIQALALLRKRSRSVAKRYPELAAALGAGFWPAFQGYAKAAPPPDCSAADAQAFARYLSRLAGRENLSPEVRRTARAILRRRLFKPAESSALRGGERFQEVDQLLLAEVASPAERG